MNNRVFIIGACRSGKSRYALELADWAFGKRKIFIAACSNAVIWMVGDRCAY